MFQVSIRQGDNHFKNDSVEPGKNLLELLKEMGIYIESPCSGKGVCGKCKVKITEGSFTKESCTPDELSLLSFIERNAGFRLACRININENISIEIPDNKNMQAAILTSGDSNVLLNPSVIKTYLELDRPSVEDQRSDVKRLEDALGFQNSMKPSIMDQLPDIMRKSDYKITAAVYNNEPVSIETGCTLDKKYGVAIDIGTTTMVGFLMDLNTGEQIGLYSALNPQRKYGADVITRTDFTIENNNGLKILSQMVRDEINKMLDYFNHEYGISSENIYHMTLVGNTIMMHIFAELPVKNIAVSPFIPVVSRKVDFESKDINININPHGIVTILPMVAGYVGSDTVAAIMACDMYEKDQISLLVDIGTNGEIALGNKDGIVACSTAAGPAFEGAHIRFGMGGVKGAINKISITDKVEFTTIGDRLALGICGSGIVDAVAEMVKSGILDSQGRIKTFDELKNENLTDTIISSVQSIDNKPAFLICSKDQGGVDDIFICQKDIREIQLAKAAVASGIRILMEEASISFEDIDNVYLAGGFGNYIDFDHATDIGLIPKELRNKIIPIGNGAGAGAKVALLSKEDMKKSQNIVDKIKYIELSTRMDFQMYFVDYLSF